MSKEAIIDKEELERCKNDKYYFFKKYVLINGKEPLMSREQFQAMVTSWNRGDYKLKNRGNYSSWDGSLNDCGDANEY